jgi:hypothetical protein
VRPGRTLAALAVVTGLGALGACGGGSRRSTTATSPAISGATIRTASCNDWRREDAAERSTLLAQMRAFFGAAAG